MASVPIGPTSVNTTCPNCQAQIQTAVESKASTKTWIIAAVLCFFCCWPCAPIPFCVQSCQNTDHSCPACKAYIGTYSN